MKTNELPRARAFLDGQVSGSESLLCAVSGGLDSMCLLHLTCDWVASRGTHVAAAHFNHHLRGKTADRDEAFVAAYCREQGIPFLSGGGDTRALARERHLSLEEAARVLRYAFLERAAREGGFAHILTAHHADDNAETMLLNLCRGTGTAGLGIPPVRGRICRPFLEISRAELTAYADAHDIPHVEDETNASDDAARNLLRHHVLPVLREINPRAVEHMAKASGFLLEDSAALDDWAARIAGQANAGPDGVRIAAELLNGVPGSVRGRTVLSLCEMAGGHRKDLSAAHVSAVLGLLRGETGKSVSLPEGLRAVAEKNVLSIFRNPRPEGEVPIVLGKTVLFGAWTVSLSSKPLSGGENFSLAPEALTAPLCVTAWRPDDRMLLPGSRGERTLKRLCGDAGMPAAQRDILPVLRVGQRAAAVPHVGVDLRLMPRPGGDAVYAGFIQHTEENRHEK